MSHQYKLHILTGSTRSASCIVALNMANIQYDITIQNFATLKEEQYLAKNPVGKAPALETPEGTLSESGAIARWAARHSNSLYGSNQHENAQVDQWYDWTRTTLAAKTNSFVYSIFGFDAAFAPKYDEHSFNKALGEFVEALKPCEQHLKGKSHLVGNSVTIADIVLICDLSFVYKFCFDKHHRDQLPNLTAYFTNLINTKDFAAVLRGYKPSEHALKIKHLGHKKDDKKDKKEHKKEEKKEAKKEEKKEAKKEAKKPAKNDDEVEEKKKEPEFPATNFDMHSFKTFFVNEADAEKKMEHLWKQFDEKAMSFWHLKYDKLPSECKKLFLTNNLMNGFVDRAAHMRKYLFGVHGVYGEPDNFNIKGIWMGKGTEELPLITEHDQHAVYHYRKLDIHNEEDRKLITEYFTKKEEDKDVVEGEILRTFTYVL